MSPLQVVIGLAIAGYLVLMVLVIKWWLFDDRTDRLMNHGEPLPSPERRGLFAARRGRPRNGVADDQRRRKAAAVHRRLGRVRRSSGTPSAGPRP